jgi:hypothetical protein
MVADGGKAWKGKKIEPLSNNIHSMPRMATTFKVQSYSISPTEKFNVLVGRLNSFLILLIRNRKFQDKIISKIHDPADFGFVIDLVLESHTKFLWFCILSQFIGIFACKQCNFE